jgi:hypothetical protein
LYGIAPQLIVVDNLMNVAAETDNEWAGLRAIMMELHDLARNTEACVLVLHHVSEASEYGDGTYPPARRSIHGKVSQLPSLMLTLGYDPFGKQLRVAAVKNRFGPNSADGKDWVSLDANYAACQISDITNTFTTTMGLRRVIPVNTNLVILPTRSRPDSAERCINALKEHSTISDFVIAIDDDQSDLYPRLEGVTYEVNPRLRMNGTLNLVANKYVDKYETIFFLGDDHLVQTPAWDQYLSGAIEHKGYGLAYGNDLLQGVKLATAVMMSTNVIKASRLYGTTKVGAPVYG